MRRVGMDNFTIDPAHLVNAAALEELSSVMKAHPLETEILLGRHPASYRTLFAALPFASLHVFHVVRLAGNRTE